MRGRRFWVLGILAVILIAVSLVLVLRPREQPAQQAFRATLTLKWLYDPGFAGEMVAVRKGFLNQEGIDLSIQPGGFEIDPIRLVASGSSQFGVTGADSFLIARSRGVPIVAIGSGYIKTGVAYYVHADSNIRTVRDFSGRTVGLQAGQDTETILYAMLGASGVDRSQVRFYPARYDLSPFLQRSVDVWPGYIATQSYTLRQQNVPFRTIRPGDVGLAIPGTVYFTTERFLREHPQEVAGFMRAVRRGWQYTYEHQDEAAEIVSSFDRRTLPKPLVLSNFRDQRDQILPADYRIGEIRRSDWESLLQILQSQRLLAGPVNLSEALRPVE